jgi:hypothetical protein
MFYVSRKAAIFYVLCRDDFLIPMVFTAPPKEYAKGQVLQPAIKQSCKPNELFSGWYNAR